MTSPAQPRVVYLIGTSPEADMAVVDQYASAEHAVVYVDGDGQAWVRDMGSANGTTVRYPNQGQTRLTLWRPGPVPIWPGCSICVGRTWIPWTVR